MIACIVMVRDEEDILPGFLAHAGALFDLILAVDHLSTDATPAILAGAAAAGLPVEVYRLRTPARWQSAVTTALAREAFARGAEWVVPLDADEFLDVPSRGRLEAMLAAGNGPVVSFRWRHAVPRPGGAGAAGWPAPPWLANPEPAGRGFNKIALHRRLAARLPGFRIGAGNHAVTGVPLAKPMSGPVVGVLWHLPLRGGAQFRAKLRASLGSAVDPAGRPIETVAESVALKTRLLAALDRAPEDAETLCRIGLRYWEQQAACLDPAAPWPAPVEVAPALAMGPVPPRGTAPPRAEALAPLPPGILLAEAHLEAGEVVVRPAPPAARLAARLEAGLLRRCKPGFRLARWLATRRERRAMACAPAVALTPAHP